MFVLNKNVGSCDQQISDLLGEVNISNVNKFINTYRKLRSVCEDIDDTVRYTSRMSDFSFFYSVYNYETLNSKDIRKIREDLNRLCRKSIETSNVLNDECNTIKTAIDKNEVLEILDIINDKINEKDKNIYNLLKNQVMSNEIDVIKDCLNDYRYFNIDRDSYYENYGSYIGFSRDSKYLDKRIDNIERQYEILNNCCELEDKEIFNVYSIIKESYDALVSSQEGTLSTQDYLDYRKNMKTLAKKLVKYDVSDAIDDYILSTRKEIHKRGFYYNKQKVKKMN